MSKTKNTNETIYVLFLYPEFRSIRANANPYEPNPKHQRNHIRCLLVSSIKSVGFVNVHVVSRSKRNQLSCSWQIPLSQGNRCQKSNT